MKVEITHPQTKEVILISAEDVDIDDLKAQFEPLLSEKKLRDIIDTLNIPAEAKVLLSQFFDYSIQIGTVVLEVGKKIIEVIRVLINKYPNISAGLVVGTVIGLLLSSIPVLGWLLGWLLMPLFAALGLALGAWKEFGNSDLGKAVEDLTNTIFAGLKKIQVQA